MKSILHELPESKDFHLKIQTHSYFKFSSNNLGFLEFLLLTTFRPVRSSNSLKAFPAMFPPSLATILLSSKPCGFSVLLISADAFSTGYKL